MAKKKTVPIGKSEDDMSASRGKQKPKKPAQKNPSKTYPGGVRG